MFYDQWTKYEEYLPLNFMSPDGTVKSKAFDKLGKFFEVLCIVPVLNVKIPV